MRNLAKESRGTDYQLLGWYGEGEEVQLLMEKPTKLREKIVLPEGCYRAQKAFQASETMWIVLAKRCKCPMEKTA